MMLAQALGDPSSAIFTADAIQTGRNRAVLEYGRWRPQLRRMGTGALFVQPNTGQAVAVMTGGPFLAGDVLTIEPFTANSETLTVSSAAPAGETVEQTVRLASVTFTANIAKSHAAGVFVSKITSTVTGGLTIVQNQDTYALPYDFVRPHQESFDIAVGARASVRRGNAFYDAAYGISGALSGVGYAGQMNYGSGYGGTLGGSASPFAMNAQGQVVSGASADEVVYRFLLSANPMLVITPVPAAGQTLDFFYWGGHTVESVPDADLSPLLDYATWAVIDGYARSLAADGDFKAGEFEAQTSKTVAGLLQLSKDALCRWDRQIVRRPYVSSG